MRNVTFRVWSGQLPGAGLAAWAGLSTCRTPLCRTVYPWLSGADYELGVKLCAM